MTAHDSTRVPSLARAALDRAAAERGIDGLVETARTDASTRVLVLADDSAPLVSPTELLWVSPAHVPEGAEWAFLGRRGDGGAVLAAVFPAMPHEPFAAPADLAERGLTGPVLATQLLDRLATMQAETVSGQRRF